MEKYFNGNDTLPGKGDFVAAFASTNLGDVSPNTKGPRCIDTGKRVSIHLLQSYVYSFSDNFALLDEGLPCDVGSSTCNGKTGLCIAFGPGEDMFESTEIIGRSQYEHGIALFQNASERLDGDVAFRHSFIDMSNHSVTLENGTVVKTCPAALGYSFAAGTTDGPGE